MEKLEVQGDGVSIQSGRKLSPKSRQPVNQPWATTASLHSERKEAVRGGGSKASLFVGPHFNQGGGLCDENLCHSVCFEWDVILPGLEAPHAVQDVELLPALGKVDASVRQRVLVPNVDEGQVLENEAPVTDRETDKMRPL